MFLILDYGVGNLVSIQNMMKKAGHDAIISGRKEDVADSQSLLLPGMGHFDNCMRRFNDSGLRPAVEKKVFEEKIPVLGICVGLQMFMEESEEGTEKGLGWIKGKVVRFQEAKMAEQEKIPNMGWLDIHAAKYSSILNDLENARFYFAHSFHVEPDNSEDQLITAHYGYDFTAAIERDNLVGVQFHPEKSHRFGLQLLNNFALKYS